MKTQRLLICVVSLGVATCFAAPTSSEDTELLKFTEDEVDRNLLQLNSRFKKLQIEVQEKIKAFHAYQNGASNPKFIWEDKSPVPEKRRDLKKILSLSIQTGLKMLSLVEDQRASLLNEKELLTVERERRQKEEISGSDTFLDTRRVNYKFICKNSPHLMGENSVKAQILEDFGIKKDKETGMKWRSQGWWVGGMSGKIRSCAEGEVAFSGAIPGRGWVVMLDHGQSVMTVYANLDPSTLNQFIQKGQKIAAGTVLGNSLDRFYFEARLAGNSIDPRKVLNTHSLQEFNL